MTESNSEKIQLRLESGSRSLWFLLILILLQFIPPFTIEPISPEQAGWLVGAVLSEAIVYDLTY
ncbi:MAG: hypothetical protein ACFE7R_10110, partial [Candidatus Hodarchaeota archaeon]